MSDYLTQLVTRNLDMAAVVRPRPASFFAPERAAQPMFDAEPSLEAITAEAPPGRSVPVRPPATHAPLDTMQTYADPPQPGTLSATPRRQPAPPPLLEASAGVASPTEAAAPHRQPAQILLQPSSSAAQPAPAPATDNGPPQRHATASQVAPAPQHVVIERDVVSEQLRAPAAAVQPAPAPQYLVIERDVVSEPSHVADAPRLSPAPLVIVQPQAMAAPPDMQPAPPLPAPLVVAASSTIQPAHRSSPATVAPQPAATTEPTVHVTIGRIEVRATLPPAPAAKPARAAAPVMSLDDYLRERGGGRR